MSRKEVRSLLAIAVLVGLLSYFTIEKELEYEENRLESIQNCHDNS